MEHLSTTDNVPLRIDFLQSSADDFKSQQNFTFTTQGAKTENLSRLPMRMRESLKPFNGRAAYQTMTRRNDDAKQLQLRTSRVRDRLKKQQLPKKQQHFKQHGHPKSPPMPETPAPIPPSLLVEGQAHGSASGSTTTSLYMYRYT